jgi:hypothetical protein
MVFQAVILFAALMLSVTLGVGIYIGLHWLERAFGIGSAIVAAVLVLALVSVGAVALVTLFHS